MGVTRVARVTESRGHGDTRGHREVMGAPRMARVTGVTRGATDRSRGHGVREG